MRNLNLILLYALVTSCVNNNISDHLTQDNTHEPNDSELLDSTHFNSRQDHPTIVLNVLDFKRNRTSNELSKLPKLFFHVNIDQEGNITDVEYNSWGTEIYKDIIADIKEILLSKSVYSDDVLQQPVKAKRLTLGVIIKTEKLP